VLSVVGFNASMGTVGGETVEMCLVVSHVSLETE